MNKGQMEQNLMIWRGGLLAEVCHVLCKASDLLGFIVCSKLHSGSLEISARSGRYYEPRWNISNDAYAIVWKVLHCFISCIIIYNNCSKAFLLYEWGSVVVVFKKAHSANAMPMVHIANPAGVMVVWSRGTSLREWNFMFRLEKPSLSQWVSLDLCQLFWWHKSKLEGRR